MNSVRSFFGAAGLVNLAVLGYGVWKKNTAATVVGGALVAANLLMWSKASATEQDLSLFGYFSHGGGNGGTGASGKASVQPAGNGNTGPATEADVTVDAAVNNVLNLGLG